MRRNFPLYARILLWFFLNVVLLAVIFAVLLRAQFQFRFDRLIYGSAMYRLGAVAHLITTEMGETPREEWDGILNRYGEAYGTQFYLFASGSQQLAGQPVTLPKPVADRLSPRFWFGRRGGRGDRDNGGARDGPGGRERGGPSPDGAGPGANGGDRGEGSGPREEDSARREQDSRRRFDPFQPMVRTSHPKAYWLFARAQLPGAEGEFPRRAAILVRSTSLSAGGLFIDFTPLVVTGAGAVVISLLLWLPLVRGITRSVAQMTQASSQIAEGQFDVRVAEKRRDELGDLGRAINQMATRLGALVGGQKRFLGDVAHELCSPLARLRVALGILEQRAEPEQAQYVDTASEKAQQMADLVNELLSFSKASLGASTIQAVPVSVQGVVEDTVAREAVQGIDIRRVVEGDLMVLGDADLLRRSVANLLRNAIRYAGEYGPIRVHARKAGDHAELTVADSGPGVPDEQLALIFDPFYRLDASRDPGTGGVGLGLTIVKTCIESCGGQVAARNRDPQGLEVVLTLPLAEEPAGGE